MPDGTPSLEQQTLDRIARQGHRLTQPRRGVVRELARAECPVSARALHDALAGGGTDLATVYRTLHWLVELGAARAVVTGEAAERFELVPPQRHSHHLRCDGCGSIRTVSVCGLDRAVLDRIEAEYGFCVDHHRLTFHGRCAACRE
jgi:Fur family transcriptional regulator, ferric uptake regulator